MNGAQVDGIDFSIVMTEVLESHIDMTPVRGDIPLIASRDLPLFAMFPERMVITISGRKMLIKTAIREQELKWLANCQRGSFILLMERYHGITMEDTFALLASRSIPNSLTVEEASDILGTIAKDPLDHDDTDQENDNDDDKTHLDYYINGPTREDIRFRVGETIGESSHMYYGNVEYVLRETQDPIEVGGDMVPEAVRDFVWKKKVLISPHINPAQPDYYSQMGMSYVTQFFQTHVGWWKKILAPFSLNDRVVAIGDGAGVIKSFRANVRSSDLYQTQMTLPGVMKMSIPEAIAEVKKEDIVCLSYVAVFFRQLDWIRLREIGCRIIILDKFTALVPTDLECHIVSKNLVSYGCMAGGEGMSFDQAKHANILYSENLLKLPKFFTNDYDDAIRYLHAMQPSRVFVATEEHAVAFKELGFQVESTPEVTNDILLYSKSFYEHAIRISKGFSSYFYTSGKVEASIEELPMSQTRLRLESRTSYKVKKTVPGIAGLISQILFTELDNDYYVINWPFESTREFRYFYESETDRYSKVVEFSPVDASDVNVVTMTESRVRLENGTVTLTLPRRESGFSMEEVRKLCAWGRRFGMPEEVGALIKESMWRRAMVARNKKLCTCGEKLERGNCQHCDSFDSSASDRLPG